jgi:hypothetical protein
VNQWNEALIPPVGSSNEPSRGLRGGSWVDSDATGMLSSNRSSFAATFDTGFVGFRVAGIPEPSSIALLAIGAIGLATMARRRAA